MIKERNAATREKKRHQELKDSLRRSPLKQQLSEYMGNGDVTAASSNGDVWSLPVSEQVVQVVVHTDSGVEIQSNGTPKLHGSNSPYHVTTHGEVHMEPCNTSNDESMLPNGDLTGEKTDSNGMLSSQHLMASDAFIPRTMDTLTEKKESFSKNNVIQTSVLFDNSQLDNGVSVGNPNYVDNGVSNGVSATNADAKITQPRPGQVNPAYDGE